MNAIRSRAASCLLVSLLVWTVVDTVDPTIVVAQEKPAEIGLTTGKQMPFHVVDFYRERGGGGCPSVMIANARTRGIVVWTRAEDESAIELARALDSKVVDGGRLHGYLVAFDAAADGLREKARGFNFVVAGKARHSETFFKGGTPASVEVIVCFLDRKEIKDSWSMAKGELTAAKIAEIVKAAQAFAADSWPIISRIYSPIKDSTIPIAFVAADGTPLPERTIRSLRELENALTGEPNKAESAQQLLQRLGRPIDWQRYMLVAITGGQTPPGFCYFPADHSLQLDKNVLTVTYRVQKMTTAIDGSDGGVVVAVVPRFDGEVGFVKQPSE